MTSLVSLSISIGVLGGIATFLALGPLAPEGAAPFVHIWIIFIGWATYFATGGNNAALKTTIVCGIWGAVCAWIAGMVLVNVNLGLPGPLWAGIVVGATVLVLCLGAHVEMLSNIPASVYGYAATAALLLLAKGLDSLTVVGIGNPLIVVSLSIAVGAVFGMLSGKLAGALGKG